MSELRNQILKSKKTTKTYTLTKIDMHSQLRQEMQGCLFVLTMDDDNEQVYYAGSYSAFGEWLSRKRVKLGRKIKLALTLGNEVEYAEILE